MRTIEISSRSRGLSRLLAKARKENLILRSPTGAEFILAEINDFEREIELQRLNPELMNFLGGRAEQPSTKSMAEVRRRLRLARPKS